jgi:hypothetical protein
MVRSSLAARPTHTLCQAAIGANHRDHARVPTPDVSGSGDVPGPPSGAAPAGGVSRTARLGR